MAATIAIPRKKRKNIRALAVQLGVSASTVQRMRKKEQVMVRHSSPLKPALNETHKMDRLLYALSIRDTDKPGSFQCCYDMVHVDEKWFYLTSDNEVYILAAGEEPPVRKTRHKSFITKVMFLSAQARPRMVNGKMWDGKIGIWPIGYVGQAARRSKNRDKGSPVWINENIDRDTYRRYLIDQVLPAILAKFPVAYLERKGVRIQQDGAKSHILPDDKEWLQALEELAPGNKITLFNQPAQSPDTNINDLAFFRSIQSLYYEAAPENEFALIRAVLDAYDDYPSTKLNRMWLTYQSCLNEIIECHGDNTYKIPHMGKEQLEREGKLPSVLPVTELAAFWDGEEEDANSEKEEENYDETDSSVG